MKRLLLPTGIVIFLIILFFLVFGYWENWFEFQLATNRDNLLLYCMLSYLVLSSDILLPIPSSIIMFMNGAVLGVFGGALLSLISGITSSCIGYFIGFRAADFSNQFFKSKETQTAQQLLNQYGWLTIIVSRGLPILAETVAIVTGNLKYRFRTFFWSNLIGYIPVCLIYAIAGHYSFEAQSLLIALAINIFLAALFWMVDRRLSILKSV